MDWDGNELLLSDILGTEEDTIYKDLEQEAERKILIKALNLLSARERSIRTFCIGKKNWMFHDSIQGAQASAVIYSISETAKLNNLRPYYYFKHLLTELPKLCDEKGNIDSAKLNHLLPWAKELPAECRKPRR